jgi:hypothetical protein
MPRGASHEVWGSFSTTHLPSPLNPGLPHPVRSVSRVSRPPDGFLLDRLPALFHAGALMEFHPFRAFPSPGAVPPLGGRCPPAVTSCERGRCRSSAERPGRPATAEGALRESAPTRGVVVIRKPRTPVDFRALLPGTSPWRGHRRVSGGRLDALLGFVLSRAFPQGAARHAATETVAIAPPTGFVVGCGASHPEGRERPIV